MASSDFASLNPALEQFIRENVVKQYNRSIVTTNLIAKQPGMGKNLAWDVSVGTGTGQVFDDGQTVSTFTVDTEVLATMAWAEYGDAFKITGLAEDAAQFSKTQLGNLWLFKMMQARERAGKLINDDLWAGTGTTSPQRLFGLTMGSNGPLSASGTYANVSRTTYPQFQGITLANGGIPRPVTLSLIEYGFEQVFNASGKIPTYGVTTSNIWRLLCELAGGDRGITSRSRRATSASSLTTRSCSSTSPRTRLAFRAARSWRRCRSRVCRRSRTWRVSRPAPARR